MTVKKTFNRALCLSLVAILAVLFPLACGGGGGGGSGSGASTKVILSGTVDSQVITQNGASSNPVPNAVVHLVDPSGNQITTTTNASGQYSALVTKLTNYGVSVDIPAHKPGARAASDPVSMRGVLFVGGSDSSLNVNPGSTAAVLVLMKLFGVTIGVPGTPLGSSLPSGNLAGVIANIYNSPGFPALAGAVRTDIANQIDPFTDPAIAALVTAFVDALTAPVTGGTTPPVTNNLAAPVVNIISCTQTGNFFGQVVLGWNPISGADGFEAYFGAAPDPFDPSGTIVPIPNSFTTSTSTNTSTSTGRTTATFTSTITATSTSTAPTTTTATSTGTSTSTASTTTTATSTATSTIIATDSGPIPQSGLLTPNILNFFAVRAFVLSPPITKPEADSRTLLIKDFGPWSNVITFDDSNGLVLANGLGYFCSSSQSFTF